MARAAVVAEALIRQVRSRNPAMRAAARRAYERTATRPQRTRPGRRAPPGPAISATCPHHACRILEPPHAAAPRAATPPPRSTTTPCCRRRRRRRLAARCSRSEVCLVPDAGSQCQWIHRSLHLATRRQLQLLPPTKRVFVSVGLGPRTCKRYHVTSVMSEPTVVAACSNLRVHHASGLLAASASGHLFLCNLR